MANRENVSADDLRETLAKVDDGDAVKRLTAAITFTEIDELTQKGAAELYGFSSSWTSKWFEEVVSGEPRDGRSRELTEQEHEQFIEVLNNPPEKAGLTRPRGLCHLHGTPFVKNSMSNTVSVMFVG